MAHARAARAQLFMAQVAEESMHEKSTAADEIANGFAHKPSAGSYYVLAMLTVIYSLNFLDRTVINSSSTPSSTNTTCRTRRWV